MNDKIFYIKHINKTFHKMEKMQRNLHNIAKNYFLLRKKTIVICYILTKYFKIGGNSFVQRTPFFNPSE